MSTLVPVRRTGNLVILAQIEPARRAPTELVADVDRVVAARGQAARRHALRFRALDWAAAAAFVVSFFAACAVVWRLGGQG